MPPAPRFRGVVLDVDSTLCGIEGIDVLAARRGPQVGQRIAELTDRAMRGSVALDAVYGERLRAIEPTRDDITAVADAYRAAIAPDAAAAIERLRAERVRVVLVSGGIREAILPTARALGIPDDDVFAVTVLFDKAGAYVGFDTLSPLATQQGKGTVVRGLIDAKRLSRPVLAVGDGATDIAMKGAADVFAAYTGFSARDAVVSAADFTIESFAELVRVVLGVNLA